jgi:glycosyltransferase involved in cell wall biosynthesis
VSPTVLRVISRLNVGGPARQAILLHEALPARGFRTVLVHGTVSPGEADLEDLLPASRNGVSKVPELGARLRPFDDFRALVALTRAVFRERPDVVHTHTAKAGTLGRLAALGYNLTRRRSRRCLVVHTFHGHVLEGYFPPAATRLVRMAERLAARVTDRIVTISPRQHSEIVERFRIAPASRVTVVPLGLELEPFYGVGDADPRLRDELGFPPRAFVVGCVGRLVPIKDVATLLEAVAIATVDDPSVRLAVVGDGPERARLEGRARQLDVHDKVVFTGWRRDLPVVYAGLDAIALSSRNEGTPVALIEAMAAGRPVVATAVGGVPDVVQHEHAGLLVPPSDPRAMAAALLRLARSPDERRRMGAAGRAAASRYHRARLIDEIEALYRSGLERKRGKAREGTGSTKAYG